MADDNTKQVPQNAIPPKAVPPPVRSSGETGGQTVPPTGGAPASALRTVRLKPIGATNAAGVPMPSVSPSAPLGTAAADDAIKRMTTRIAMMANEIDPNTGKRRTVQIPSEGDSSAKRATVALASFGDADSGKKVTSTLPLSATARIPDLSDTPKTIKIRPSPATQPVPVIEPPPVFSQPPAQQAAGKSKTSRIPLDSAMVVPQSTAAPTESAGGSQQKTVKLKRPEEIASSGAGAGRIMPPAAGAEQAEDNSTTTQKKTIRVKRPTTVSSNDTAGQSGVAEGDDGVLTAATLTPLDFATSVPERGTGWFIALAVVCILAAVAATGVFFVQLYGTSPNTHLDEQFQKG